MRKVSVLTTFAVATFVFIQSVNALAAADEPADEPAARQAAIRAAIQNLLATVDVYAASEKPRLGKRADGTLEFFGAPPGAPARLDPALDSAPPEEKALAFLTQHAAAFGISDAAVALEPKKTRVERGETFVKLGQFYSDIPVFCGEVGVQVTDDGIRTVLADIMAPEGKISVATVPSITAAAAGEIASATLELDAGELAAGGAGEAPADGFVALPGAELFIYDPAVVGNKGEICLVWQVTVLGNARSVQKYRTLVDAVSGKVVLYHSLINDAENRVVGEHLEQDQQGNFYVVPIRSEGDPPSGISEVDNTYDMLGDAYDFYASFHGRDGLDDDSPYDLLTQPAAVDIYPYNWMNSTAFWDPDLLYMKFGGGFVCDDVVGHEYTHGVTQFESNLEYLNESGAINESFSDIWGEFIDLTNGRGNDSQSVRWQCAEELCALRYGGNYCYGPLRYMDDPGQNKTIGPNGCLANPGPDRMNSPDWQDYHSDPSDWGGVHKNLGVNSKLCYLLTDGDDFRGRTITGLGIDLVADLYYYCQLHLTSGADHANLYEMLTEAAITLGCTDSQRRNIEEACRAVEIRPTRSMSI